MTSAAAGTVTLGTRGSALARRQTDWVQAALLAAWPGLTCRVEVLSTTGDRLSSAPLPEVGGKGLFTAELEEALRAGRIDLAVHSLKDLPVDEAPGLVVGAVPEREDPHDALVCPAGHQLSSLPHGARVGTSSLRRAAQLRYARRDLDVQPVRGNVDTRLRKAQAGEYHALVLAAAGLRRLGLEAAITQVLPSAAMLPAPGQGALAVQCRAGDENTRRLLAALEHAPTRTAVTAERAFLAALGGGCSLPVGTLAHVRADGQVEMEACVLSPDGHRIVRLHAYSADAAELGRSLAVRALDLGAGALLA